VNFFAILLQCRYCKGRRLFSICGEKTTICRDSTKFIPPPGLPRSQPRRRAFRRENAGCRLSLTAFPAAGTFCSTARLQKLLALDLVDFRLLMARYHLAHTTDAEAKRRAQENKQESK
jgi:hypothetical protein